MKKHSQLRCKVYCATRERSQEAMAYDSSTCAQWTLWRTWCPKTSWLSALDQSNYATIQLEGWRSTIKRCFPLLACCARLLQRLGLATSHTIMIQSFMLLLRTISSSAFRRQSRLSKRSKCLPLSRKSSFWTGQGPLRWVSRSPLLVKQRHVSNIWAVWWDKDTEIESKFSLIYVSVQRIYSSFRL